MWDDPSLDDPEAAVEDRAEARLLRGDLSEALALLEDARTTRAIRIRAEALEGLGHFADADAAVEPVVDTLKANRFTSASELVEGVRCLILRARLRGQPAEDYKAIMTLLARARDSMDRLHWPVTLVEAELLLEKDNREEAAAALEATLRLNPSCARAWALRGRMAVESFNFDGAQVVASTLDAVSRRLDFDGGPTGEFSPYADLTLAHAWLRQNDPDLAEEELRPTLERYPRMRAALALRAAVVAVRYDFTRTEDLLAEFDRLSPGSPEALYRVGKALSETRQYAEAAEYLRRASDRQPRWPAPLIELGLLEVQSGRDDRALAALTAASELDPFNERARNSLALLRSLQEHRTVESEHFIVRYAPGVDGMMAREMLPVLEEIHRVVGGAIEHTPAQKTVIELSPNHKQFAVRIVGMSQIHTIAASTGPVIAMEAPKVGKGHTGEYDWERVIRHEYVHTVTLSRTRNRIPHWFTEAAAVFLEGAPRDYSTCQLLVRALQSGELFDMVQINVAFVRPKKPTDRSQAYAQGHWMYQFMVERFGAGAPLALMDLYATGVREDAAMRQVLGVTREQFFEMFKPWAVEQAESWGMLPRPTIREMLLEDMTASAEGRGKAEAALASFAQGAAMAALSLGPAPEFELQLPAPDGDRVTRWLAQRPDHPDVLQLAISRIDAAGGGAELVGLLERYAAARPVDPMPHQRLALHYLAAESLEERAKAAPHLEFLDAREQKTPTYAIELARLYAETGDAERARVKAERATRIAPFDAGHREIAAQINLLAGDLAAAERHIAALTEIEPDRPVHRQRLERVRELRGAQGGT